MEVHNRLIEFIRHIGISQQTFELKAELSAGAVTRLNNNVRKGTLTRIKLAFPQLNIDWLLTGEGEMIVSGQGLYMSNPNAQMQNALCVPLVSKYAYAGFLAGYGDDDYNQSLPRVTFPVPQAPHGEYYAFEVSGDSMNNGSEKSIIDGDILLCRKINNELWTNSQLHIHQWFFVIVTNEGILVKQIIEHNINEHYIVYHSLNPLFEDEKIGLQNVRMILNVVQYFRKPIF